VGDRTRRYTVIIEAKLSTNPPSQSTIIRPIFWWHYRLTIKTFTKGKSLMLGVKSILASVALLMASAPSSIVRTADLNDYPTSARVDYVFACMKANGETQVSLQKCSCSIDVIASLLSYDRYVTAQTVLSMSQVPGNLGAEFRSTEIARAALEDLRRAQAEAEVRCF
jgi:hypothetical protein